MISQEIRRNFLNYFKDHGHSILSSSSVVPHDDPSLLFTNAGMNQFKDVFLGKTFRDFSRASTSQKCIRVGGKHNDLDNVGHTTRHLTFFEMLGNFSFGDYFKEDAIRFAWQVTTEVFGFDPDKVWATVFREDNEAYELWRKILPESRIVRMGEKDNFWAMGETGPCGPCSELLFDRGSNYGNASSPAEDTTGERYLEFWNLVFMQFNRDSSGKLTNLPKQSIDTGAGLERVVSLKMGVDNVFATDIFLSLISQIEMISGKKYVAIDSSIAPAFHVIADHIRSLSFAIADGAQPSNTERGYVLRKILRRAVRYGKTLGINEPFLAKVLPKLVEVMGSDYPELISSQHRIAEIVTIEEEAFFRTLKRGGNLLQQVIEKAQQSPNKQIAGEEAFKLKDTYGFPLEEILLLAKDSGLEVNLETYRVLETEAREKSKNAQVSHNQEAENNLFENFSSSHGKSEFIGFHSTEGEGSILALIHEGQFVDDLKEGQDGLVVLDRTPFYAEKGGQVADKGILTHDNAHFDVKNCYSPYPDIIIHEGKLDKGCFILGEPVRAFVDSYRRQKIASNHTATHLLHFALEKVLGSHIKQAGSLVEESRLRFDFSHHKSLTKHELAAVERIINEKIRENLKVCDYELSYEDAQKRSDIKQFFGEKYGSKVRVVDMDISKELCGGTHTHQTGSIGLFRILKEGSVAAGVRRIEAVTGQEAEELMYSEQAILEEAASQLKVPSVKLLEKLNALLEEQKHLSTQIKSMKKASLAHLSQELVQQAEKINSFQVILAIAPIEIEDANLLLDDVMAKNAHGITILGIKSEQKCYLVVRVSSACIQKGIHAGQLIKEMAPLIGGKGGGKPDSAQAGGLVPEGIHEALSIARKLIEAAC
ncbi:MAG: alanine--tRNA ligase [Chlamydiae bacterium]|nr:alanine--tRNA ligase [Chlamydiota bacterium]